LRAELRKLRSALDRFEGELDRLEQEDSGKAPRIRPVRYYRVLVAVYERGVHGITSEEFADLGRAHGYDRRGLGGYFAGGRAPLRLTEGRVALTTEGSRLVREYLEREAA
jgi:hypothetical protein